MKVLYLTSHGGCIDCVTDKLTQENFIVAVKKFLNDGEDVFGCDPDFSVCHNIDKI